MKILIADDSKMARKIVIKTLKESINSDFSTIEATNGLEAFELYKEHQPTALFLDLTMPVMDGFEALSKIKAYDKDAKVIVVSADIQKTSMDTVRELGAIDFIKKPINADKVQTLLKKIS